jgi:hypothetical protein
VTLEARKAKEGNKVEMEEELTSIRPRSRSMI